MAFGFLILAAILLGVVAIAGLGIYAVPVVLVGLGSLAFLYANRAKRVADTEADKGTPQDSKGGPEHKREDYAHTGQAHMTPEQMRGADAR